MFLQLFTSAVKSQVKSSHVKNGKHTTTTGPVETQRGGRRLTQVHTDRHGPAQRHCGGAAVRLRLTDHAQANPPAFLGPLGGRLQGREATHEATGTRSPSWRLRASLALPAALAGRRLGPLALPPAMASWPPVCSLGRSRNCSHVRSNKRGEAMAYALWTTSSSRGGRRYAYRSPRTTARGAPLL